MPDLTRSTRGRRAHVLEYSQARGLLLDPARVRAPRDKPHVENGIKYVRERWWKGSRFIDLADSRQQSARVVPRGGWCARTRHHATFATRRL